MNRWAQVVWSQTAPPEAMEREKVSTKVMNLRLHNAGKLVQVEAVGRDVLEDRSLVCLVEELLYVSLDIAGEELPAVALEGDSICPDEELLEVPGHVVPADWAPDD